jgi:hypothetical protein
MNANGGDPELLDHYSVLVYPFRHRAVGRQRNVRLGELDSRWAPWASRFTEHDLAATLEATAFFLPYVRGLLYPDVVRLREATPCEDHGHWARLLSAWSAAGTNAYVVDLPASGVVRLTLRNGLLRLLQEFTIFRPPSPVRTREIDELYAHCSWIDAVLFPSGLGFLLLHVRLNDEQPRLSSLVQLNGALRYVHPLTRSVPMPVLRLANGHEMTVRDLMNYLTQGLAGPWNIPEEERGILATPRCDLDGHPYTDSETGRSYGERCYVLSYGCIDLAKSSAEELPCGAFASPVDRILFEYSTSIGLGESVNNPVWVPSPDQAARISRDHRLSLWNCWTGMVLKESLVFLGTEDLGFTRRSLPRHVENDYLPLYLLTIYQKLQLFTFATDMMHEVAHSCGHLRGARALQERFVTFRSQYWFSEVTRKPQGGELYRTFQRGLEVQNSYDMVTSSIKDVKDYYESVWARQVQLCKDALTYGGPVTMALGAARMIIGDSPHIWTCAAAAAVGTGLVLLLRACRPIQRWSRWVNRRTRARKTRRLTDVSPREDTSMRAAA